MLALCSAAFSCDPSFWPLLHTMGLLIGPVKDVAPEYVLVIGFVCSSPSMGIIDDFETFVKQKGVKINYLYGLLMYAAYALYCAAYFIRGRFRGKRRISFAMFGRVVWVLHLSRCVALLTRGGRRTCTG